MTDESVALRLSRLPQVQAVLLQPEVVKLLAELPRWSVVQAVRDELSVTRRKLLDGTLLFTDPKLVLSMPEIARRARELLTSSLRKVVNATGVVLHTNLGRAPLAERALRRMEELASGYCNLEYQLDSGTRGSRQQPLSRLLHKLTGAEAHLVVNNNAAAVLLALGGLCAGREVVVSRGELVEIGGSFRVPDVMEASGARLREVGTTNRTHLRDYLAATGDATAAYLKVHRSNFAQVGFVAEVGLAELAHTAHERGLLCLYDLGSGALLRMKREGAVGEESAATEEDSSSPAEMPEPTVAEVIAQGCDVVMLSGDKLLGGPQAGILCGSATVMAKLAKHPLLRALRPDKLTLAALEATLELYRDGLTDQIPTWRMLQMSEVELRSRAELLQAALTQRGVSATLVRVRSAVGGGAQPLRKPWSWAVSPTVPAMEVLHLQAALRRHDPPVIARVSGGRLLCDVRTISEAELPICVSALAQAVGPGRSV